jgi:hypothetical protein
MSSAVQRRSGTYVLATAALLMALYVVFVLVVDRGEHVALRLAVGLMAVAAFGLFIAAEVRMLRELDELQRRIQLEALAIAFPTAILAVFTLGVLERAGIVVWGFQRLRDVWPLVVLPYLLGLAIAMRRYR